MSSELAIVVHCSDSSWGNAAEIRKWHLERGWDDIGYQYVIGNGRPYSDGDYDAIFDGNIETGRRTDGDSEWEPWEYGAHVRGHNNRTIGICLVGVDTFTPKQIINLVMLCGYLDGVYGRTLPVYGHYELDDNKTCPNIDMVAMRKGLSVLTPYSRKGIK